MISDTKKIANAVGGKTARACDCCIRRRARWYCAADDAFLCQTCDASVHSANPLARRHHRVRLKTASSSSSSLSQPDPIDLPPWQRGLTRKARTPRHGKNPNGGSKSEERSGQNPPPTVPDLGSDDTTSSHGDETDDQLLYQVPVFDPFVQVEGFGAMRSTEIKSSQNGYQPLDMDMDMDDLEEFAADVETLLGKGLDEESYGIEELGLLDSGNYANNNNKDMDDHIFHDHFPYDYGKLVIKAENNDELLGNNIGGEDVEIREPFDLSFDVYGDDFPSTCQGQSEEQRVMKVEALMAEGERHDFCNLGEVDDEEEKNKEREKKRKISLRLDYEAISVAWASQSQASPWINGQRPEINPDDYWPNCTGTSGAELRHPLFGGNNGVMRDGGREARVSRYREKRRTRLFAKKIRYEVRKLNAEKRPRMKGRFVKRTSFAPSVTNTSFPLLSK